MKVTNKAFAASMDVSASHVTTKSHPNLDALSFLVLGGTATAAESYTWTFQSPWNISDDHGRVVYISPNLTITKIRAALTTGGYNCVYSIASDLDSKLYMGNNPPLGYKPQGFRLDAKNAQGGVLFSFSWDQVLNCGANRIYQNNSFNPDIYDIWATCTFSILPFMHTLC